MGRGEAAAASCRCCSSAAAAAPSGAAASLPSAWCGAAEAAACGWCKQGGKRRQRFNWGLASRARPTCNLRVRTLLAGAGSTVEGWQGWAGWAGTGWSTEACPPASAMTQCSGFQSRSAQGELPRGQGRRGKRRGACTGDCSLQLYRPNVSRSLDGPVGRAAERRGCDAAEGWQQCCPCCNGSPIESLDQRRDGQIAGMRQPQAGSLDPLRALAAVLCVASAAALAQRAQFCPLRRREPPSARDAPGSPGACAGAPVPSCRLQRLPAARHSVPQPPACRLWFHGLGSRVRQRRCYMQRSAPGAQSTGGQAALPGLCQVSGLVTLISINPQ